MRRKACVYKTCKSDSRYSHKPHMKGVVFFPFPKPKRNWEKCKRWIDWLCREDYPIERVGGDTYVCSKHFISGNGPTKEYPDPVHNQKELVSILRTAGVVRDQFQCLQPNNIKVPIDGDTSSSSGQVSSETNRNAAIQDIVPHTNSRKISKKSTTRVTFPGNLLRLPMRIIYNEPWPNVIEERTNSIMSSSSQKKNHSPFRKSWKTKSTMAFSYYPLNGMRSRLYHKYHNSNNNMASKSGINSPRKSERTKSSLKLKNHCVVPRFKNKYITRSQSQNLSSTVDTSTEKDSTVVESKDTVKTWTEKVPTVPVVVNDTVDKSTEKDSTVVESKDTVETWTEKVPTVPVVVNDTVDKSTEKGSTVVESKDTVETSTKKVSIVVVKKFTAETSTNNPSMAVVAKDMAETSTKPNRSKLDKKLRNIIYRCVYKGCTNNNINRSLDPKLVFHNFPRSEPLRSQWLKNIGFENGKIISSTKVCSVHFTPESYEHYNRYINELTPHLYVKKFLKRTAAPLVAKKENVGSLTPIKMADNTFQDLNFFISTHQNELLHESFEQQYARDESFEPETIIPDTCNTSITPVTTITPETTVTAVTPVTTETPVTTATNTLVPRTARKTFSSSRKKRKLVTVTKVFPSTGKKRPLVTITKVAAIKERTTESQTELAAIIAPGPKRLCHTGIQAVPATVDKATQTIENQRLGLPLTENDDNRNIKDKENAPAPVAANYQDRYLKISRDGEVSVCDKNLLVNEEALLNLFEDCTQCVSRCVVSAVKKGSAISVYSVCPNNHTRNWTNQI